MKLKIDDVKKLIKIGAIKTSNLGSSKGSTLIFYKGKSFYVWKGHKEIFLQSKWFWNKKYIFDISEITA